MSINTFANLPDFHFEQCMITPELISLRGSGTQKIIGYVNKDCRTQGWFWFRGSFISTEQFNTPQEALEDLVKLYTTKQLDIGFQKAGLINDETRVKR